LSKETTTIPPQQELDSLLEHYQNGRHEDAEKLAILLTEQFQNHPLSWKVLAILLSQTGRLNEALVAGEKLVSLTPDDAEAHYNLSITLKWIGRMEEAEISCKQAIALKPDYAEAHNNLGNTQHSTGKMREAEVSYNKAIALKLDYVQAYYSLGVTLNDLDRKGEAELIYNKAIALNPDYAEAHSNLGDLLQESYRLEEAEASCRKAISLKPDLAEAHNNLALTLQKKDKLEEAEASCRQAISLKPDLAEAHNNLGNTLNSFGRLEEAETSFKKAIALKPDFTDCHSNLLFSQSSSNFEHTRYLKDALGYVESIKKGIGPRFSEWSCVREPERLRIGLVSGDFRNHPVGFFLEGVLAQFNSASLELYAYPTSPIENELTARIKPYFSFWSPLCGKSDKEAAELIHNDNIHILIDLSGHTARNRLPIFAWKPAPIQVSWLGYWASSGVPEIDYILGDPFVTPYDEAVHFTEKIWQLPESYLCFTEPNVGLEVMPLPALSTGGITFGCFNKLSKMTDEVVSLRARILHATPGSKLFLKDNQLQEKSVRNKVLSRFAAHGIVADQLILEGPSPRAEYLACYNRVDIALSPYPYGGGTTSAEGLWMGVPVLTKRGDHFLSHLGESIAHNTGLSDWIAADEDEYIAKAVKFSSDLDGLMKLRAGLRAQVLASPLFDAARFAAHFEEAVWSMWSKWKETKSSQ